MGRVGEACDSFYDNVKLQTEWLTEEEDRQLHSPWVGEACDAVRARQGNCVFVLNHHLLCSSILGYLALVDSQSSTDIKFQLTAFGFLLNFTVCGFHFPVSI